MIRLIAVLLVVLLTACREDQQDGGTDERIVTEDGAIEFHLPGGFELTPDVPIAPPPGTRTFGVARAGATPDEFEFVVGILSAGVRPPFDLKGEQGQASRDRLTRTARNGGATGFSAELTERPDRIELVVEFETRLETLSQEAYVAFEAGPYVFIVAEATGQSLTKDEQDAIFDAIIATLEFRES